MTLAILLSPGRVAFAVAIAGLAAFLAVPAAAVSLEDALALDRVAPLVVAHDGEALAQFVEIYRQDARQKLYEENHAEHSECIRYSVSDRRLVARRPGGRRSKNPYYSIYCVS